MATTPDQLAFLFAAQLLPLFGLCLLSLLGSALGVRESNWHGSRTLMSIGFVYAVLMHLVFVYYATTNTFPPPFVIFQWSLTPFRPSLAIWIGLSLAAALAIALIYNLRFSLPPRMRNGGATVISFGSAMVALILVIHWILELQRFFAAARSI